MKVDYFQLNHIDYFDSSLSAEKLLRYDNTKKISNLRSPYDLEFSNQLLRHNFKVELISSNVLNQGTRAKYKIRRLKQPRKRSPLSSKIEKRVPSTHQIHYNNNTRTDFRDNRNTLSKFIDFLHYD